MDTTLLITIGVVAALVVVAALLLVSRLRQKKQSKNLQERFGPEYERTLAEEGDRESAEQELQRREERRARFDIRPLEPAERERYAEACTTRRSCFVDAPGDAIGEADDLVSQVMRDRGYPVEDFAQRAEDLSVDHAGVVEDYRAANRVAVAHRRGDASTEDLRQALVHYRSLFAQLLGDSDG